MLMTEFIPIRPNPFHRDIVSVKVLVIQKLCVVYFYDQSGEQVDKHRLMMDDDEYSMWGVRDEFLVELSLDKMGLERQ